MNVDELDQKLLKHLELFTDEMHSAYSEEDLSSASKADIHTCARETYYLVNEFRKEVIEYLKSDN